jgi:hypothetical protein
MKKIAAVAIAGALTAGVTAISQPADAYAAKPTSCLIAGAGKSAPIYYAGKYRSYPAQFAVKAPGAVPAGGIHAAFYGAGQPSYAKVLKLAGGTVATRTSVPKAGTLKIKVWYNAQAGFTGCSKTFSVTIK